VACGFAYRACDFELTPARAGHNWPTKGALLFALPPQPVSYAPPHPHPLPRTPRIRSLTGLYRSSIHSVLYNLGQDFRLVNQGRRFLKKIKN
jgi:hypothetical protein